MGSTPLADRIPQPAGEIQSMAPPQEDWWIAGLMLAWLVGKAKYVPTESGYILTRYPPNLVFLRI